MGSPELFFLSETKCKILFCSGSEQCCFQVLQFHHFSRQQSPAVIQLQRTLRSGNRKAVNRPLSHGRKVVGSTSLGLPGQSGFSPWYTDFRAQPGEKHIRLTACLCPVMASK